VLTLVNGLSVTRNLLGPELLHLGLQGSAEGGPHIARFVVRVKPYKLKQFARYATRTRQKRRVLYPGHCAVAAPLSACRCSRR